ncbi:MAG: hypothetical protein ACREC0_07605 [Methylocella sp.]
MARFGNFAVEPAEVAAANVVEGRDLMILYGPADELILANGGVAAQTRPFPSCGVTA